ncbi:MAG: CpsD/CapB family tyrosine-protein kinase, partial [Clostridia bacterium]|nr:CpsD/CapB family tyrosine-protein kinase [Clostridia bacterium]
IPHESKYKTIKEYIKHGKKSVLISNVSSSYLFVEAFYKLRTKLEYVMGKKDHKVLLITSVRENEGKSSVAANTALALASGGKKVLLIDCDLRNPSQNKLFEIKPEKGSEFADYLYGRCPFEEAVWKDDRYGLNLMVSRIPRENSVEILSNPSMEKLIENMRKEMDYIILDTSPMLLTADAEHLLRHADAALLVIKQNYSSAININDATDILTSYKAELLGCVFNDVHHGIFEKGQKAYYGKGRYTGQYEINAAAENMYEQQDS